MLRATTVQLDPAGLETAGSAQRQTVSQPPTSWHGQKPPTFFRLYTFNHQMWIFYCSETHFMSLYGVRVCVLGFRWENNGLVNKPSHGTSSVSLQSPSFESFRLHWHGEYISSLTEQLHSQFLLYFDISIIREVVCSICMIFSLHMTHEYRLTNTWLQFTSHRAVLLNSERSGKTVRHTANS